MLRQRETPCGVARTLPEVPQPVT